MGSVGTQEDTNHYEAIKGTPLIFGMANVRKEFIDIDGYSNKKTIAGALSDLAKALDKYDKGEADALRYVIKNKEITQILPDRNIGGAQYLLDWEEVPSASRYVDSKGIDSLLSDEDDSTHTIEYKDARWYVHTRVLR